MNLRNDILRDEFLAAVARRRQRRRTTAVAAVLVPVVAVAFMHLRPAPPEAMAVAETPAVTEPAPAPKPLPYETIDSDEELLALLSDQGPVLVRHANGTQSLILTAPHQFD